MESLVPTPRVRLVLAISGVSRSDSQTTGRSRARITRHRACHHRAVPANEGSCSRWLQTRFDRCKTAEQEAELVVLSRSDAHGEANRARAILLTLQDWTGGEVAEAFGITLEAVRHWRGWFSKRSVDVDRLAGRIRCSTISATTSTMFPSPTPA